MQENKSLLELKSSTTDACPYVIKKQEQVIEETEAMIDSSSKRLLSAKQDLEEFVKEFQQKKVENDKDFQTSLKECVHLLSTVAPLPTLQ